MYRELTTGRKGSPCGFVFASRCYVLVNSAFDVAEETTKEAFSMEKLKDVKVLTTTALLVALGIVLGLFKIPISETIQINFMVVPYALAGFLYGPFIGALTGILVDIGGYLVRPTGPFFPGFTLVAGLSGLLYGVILFRKEPTLTRVAFAQGLQTLICGILGTTVNLVIMYGMPFWGLLVSRIPKEIILYPVYTALILLLTKVVQQIRKE